ncbi:MAG: (Fe-S)-binding protein [Archangiaceae bacterium]|nr:(Fe-S)-binding protein [Archangiaceae bacterium]
MKPMEQHAREYSFCAYCPKVCRFSCPVSESTKTETTSTWGKMTAAHLALTHQRPLDEGSAKALHACTGCMRCTEFCKHHNQPAGALFAARSATIAKGLQPAGAASTLATFAQSQNPFGRQLAPLVAAWKAETPVRYPFFPGCTALVKRSELIDQTLAVASAFGAPLGVSRAAARCCGYPLYAAGAFELFQAHARAFAETIEAYPELVVKDPSCAFTLKVIYPRFEVKMPARIRTVYEVLDENLPHAPVKPPMEEAVAYHDACHLGRGLQQYDEPRRLLRRAVSSVREAPSSGAEGGCSGGGGLLPRTLQETSVDVARRQAAELQQDGETIVTACPTSRRMFERAGRQSEDLLAVLKRWLDTKEGP